MTAELVSIAINRIDEGEPVMTRSRRITGVVGVCVLAIGVRVGVGSSTATAQTFGYDIVK